jgi:hypothetical protein
MRGSAEVMIDTSHARGVLFALGPAPAAVPSTSGGHAEEPDTLIAAEPVTDDYCGDSPWAFVRARSTRLSLPFRQKSSSDRRSPNEDPLSASPS